VTFTIDLSYHPSMSHRATYRIFGKDIDSDEIIPVEAETAAVDSSDDEEDSTVFKTLGWISAGLGAVALGLFVGRELRQRYKFNRRTPYDFYAHSGDEQDVDFGLGI
jgi:hypothetical protein